MARIRKMTIHSLWIETIVELDYNDEGELGRFNND